ncbi:hypothetical protein C5N14_14280 [Micromonospora sp. MW-13]|uniref:helix-turn-helix domain-containing protein n=1 Tax=Micromonospora sp. MW-13 TaxID=2094022 RepID=UPI000E43189D|nr:helix-turn-helix transcriptional regulator [Micromonospora sp. MW-13]RGC68257.1 hypothetical protein C5N14_14280 [Micromonospora sp. MW-13]
MNRMPMLELFAGELRRLRSGAGLSQEALGERVNYSASLVAAVEQCRRPPREEFTQRCDEALRADGLLVRIRETLVRESLMPWFREWVTIEQEATALRSFEPLVVPGLLQTEAYARALERPVGGPDVMREQLRHLVEVGRRSRVHLHLVPRGVGAYPGLNGAFVLATPPDSDDVGYLDNQLQGTIVERTVDVHLLRQVWESVRAEALPHGATLTAISEAAEAWT